MNDKPKTLPALRSGGAVAPIVPQSFEDAYRMANVVVTAGMAPKSVNTPERAMVAIMHGMEVGLTPMAALQSIAVVNGMPTIWGDGALGLVRASGELVGFKEWKEGAPGQETAFCQVTRRGYEDEPTVQTFSHEDAQISGLLNKDGPWKLYPGRMKQMRARSWALRDAFADVLRGLRITEEAQDIPAEIITEDGEVLSRPAQILAQKAAAKAQQRAEPEDAEFEVKDDPAPEGVVDDPAPEPEADAPTAEEAQDDQSEPEGAKGATAATSEEYDALSFAADLHAARDWPMIEAALNRLRKSDFWADAGKDGQNAFRRSAFLKIKDLVEAGLNFDFLDEAQAWRCYLEFEIDIETAKYNRKVFTQGPAWCQLSTAAKLQLDAAWTSMESRIRNGQDAAGEDSGRAFA